MLWLILGFPLLGAIVNGLLLRKVSPHASHLAGSLALVASFGSAVMLFTQFMAAGGEPIVFDGFDWIQAGNFNAPMQFVFDRLSALMTLIITGIGSLIHIYAGGYMHEEERTSRFFAYLNLFVFMMLLLVLGNNMLVMFVGWEGVGLCSYLLIGYWFEHRANAEAGMKAFVVNRIGDFGFLIGIFLTYEYFGTVSFSELKAIVAQGNLPPQIIALVGWITIALFVGACGKSAQIPLYVWMPDAMAGPTPVSALIHAATMVTAGIYMMTRMHFFYLLAPTTMLIVATIGALTAFMAASIAVVQNDIKKVLAYSTVSQLGYMVLACGVAGFGAGVFHLFTHACFKALLFMGAGSVIVAMHHKQDMMEMGGLKKYMPITHLVMLVGVLAIIGFPGTSGFFSKDEILWHAYLGGGFPLWGLATFTAVCTSFYMVRLLCLTFYGPNRSDHHTQEHLHETSAVMWAPLVVLAILSATVGFLGVPEVLGGHNAFHHYLEPIMLMPEQAKASWEFLHAEHSHSLELGLMAASVSLVLIAAMLAVKLYANGPAPVLARIVQRRQRLYTLLQNKYFVDEIYQARIVEPLKDMAGFVFRIIDVRVVDGMVNGVGQACALIGGLTSLKMTGSVHRHATAVVLGLLCLLTILFI